MKRPSFPSTIRGPLQLLACRETPTPAIACPPVVAWPPQGRTYRHQRWRSCWSIPAGLGYLFGLTTLSWDTPSDAGITDYRFLPRVAGMPELQIHVDDSGSAAASYDDTQDMAARASYIHRVVARNAIGTGPWSKPVSITTPAAP